MMERFFEVILLLLDISFLLLSIQQKLANALKFHVISRWLCILLLSLLQDEFKVKNEEESKKEEPTNPEKKVFYTLTGVFFVTEILFYPKMVIVQVVTNLIHFPSLLQLSLLIEVLALYFYNWIYFFNILRVGISFYFDVIQYEFHRIQSNALYPLLFHSTAFTFHSVLSLSYEASALGLQYESEICCGELDGILSTGLVQLESAFESLGMSGKATLGTVESAFEHEP
ncbi:MAG: hypothetical protein EZS28_045676, partial [Streblomastix strix]